MRDSFRHNLPHFPRPTWHTGHSHWRGLAWTSFLAGLLQPIQIIACLGRAVGEFPRHPPSTDQGHEKACQRKLPMSHPSSFSLANRLRCRPIARTQLGPDLEPHSKEPIESEPFCTSGHRIPGWHSTRPSDHSTMDPQLCPVVKEPIIHKMTICQRPPVGRCVVAPVNSRNSTRSYPGCRIEGVGLTLIYHLLKSFSRVAGAQEDTARRRVVEIGHGTFLIAGGWY